MGCVVLTGYDLLCKLEDSGSGARQTVYLGLVSDLDQSNPFDENGSGDVNSINFQNYKGFVKFVGLTNGNTANYDIQKTDDGNPFYPMSMVLKLFDTTTDDKTFLTNLAKAEDVFGVIESANGRFEIVGTNPGLKVESAPRTLGLTPQDSSARVLTLSGDQVEIEKLFSVENRTQTVATLDSYVI